ncbi:hypothetical protein QUV83_00375 [Cellulomonas cellasea]|uniref:hypothetical protein n=1 Tax=Cellulomonas cellasea TaxID=43670 RepID=UPI0025A43B4A|nr:hypothetical protein [Cellulomonas cellasea]MDM8083222.1 hypothetical protein [Cellulomonas cellasea]
MRRPGARVAIIAALGVVVAGGVVTHIAMQRGAAQARTAAAPAVAQADLAQVRQGPHIVFRSTAPGDEYGLVAAVPLDAPDGPRAFTDVACDRVDATSDAASCLRTLRGVVTRYEARLLDAEWQTVQTWPLPGLPSRTRLSADATLLSSTSFVTGHSYASVGFSTETVVHRADGSSFGNLEEFALTVGGEPFTALDRNIWGVTFVDDDAFYATAASASAGATWLVRGSLSARTLEALRENVECPSLSPDGTRVAFKRDVGEGGTPYWAIAVLDLATDAETVLAEERDVDDQVEWLDDDTLLYGMPRDDDVGVTDVWAIPARPDAAARVLIPQAWSPAVVQDG